MAMLQQRVEESQRVGTNLRTGPTAGAGTALREGPARRGAPSQPEGTSFQPGPVGSRGEQEPGGRTPAAVPSVDPWLADRRRARQGAEEQADNMWARSRGRLSSAQFANARGAVGDALEVSDRMRAIRQGGWSSAVRYALGVEPMSPYTASLYRAAVRRRAPDRHPGYLIPGNW
jgi:hypothetical protein